MQPAQTEWCLISITSTDGQIGFIDVPKKLKEDFFSCAKVGVLKSYTDEIILNIAVNKLHLMSCHTHIPKTIDGRRIIISAVGRFKDASDAVQIFTYDRFLNLKNDSFCENEKLKFSYYDFSSNFPDIKLEKTDLNFDKPVLETKSEKVKENLVV